MEVDLFEVILASVGYAGGIVVEKIILSRYKVPVRRYLPLLFIWLVIIAAIFMPKWGGFEFNFDLNWKIISLFTLMVISAVGWNIFSAIGVQKEDLIEYELIMLLTPLATIIFAAMFLPSEREWRLFIPGIIAALALLFSRFKSHHVKISAVAWKTIFAMLLIAIESIFIKELLSYFSPITLYFCRVVVIASVFVLMYKPKLMHMKPGAFGLTIISAVFGMMQMILKFYGFQTLGVIETTMILVMGPFFVYLASTKLFKEKLRKRDVAAAMVVVLCVLYVEFWR